jgi:2-polyprenyl-3-methyl-5-hydroxy-6-metoxy-1,4-benzoquinol methylase
MSNNKVRGENIYGHGKRLAWILSHIRKSDKIIEFGCGTGFMITLPLTALGYDVYGLDIDQKSVELGKVIFHDEGLDPSRVQDADFASFTLEPDIVIASEVLEHVADGDLPILLQALRSKLKPGGKLLVTVPNGYGWFELESFLWFKTGIGICSERFRIDWCIRKVKSWLFGTDMEERYPSTLSPSPHLQRFTLRSITDLLTRNGFAIMEKKGSVLFSGPFSNILFTGIKPVMKLNSMLGDLCPPVASGFYICAVKRLDMSAAPHDFPVDLKRQGALKK